jgi:YesN/AraC family two-component response regulator
VDDEPMLRTIYERWLTMIGCGSVHTAADGRSALTVLESHPVDVLITDIRMPIMDGVTLVRHLARLPAPAPGIIVMSGFGDIDLREMYALGVEAFLTKPSLREALLEVMQNALAQRGNLWQTPMSVAPRQTMVIPNSTESRQDGEPMIQLGHGGFSTRYAEPLSLGKVSFQITERDRELTGQGYVRWNSRAEQSVGIEFTYLEESCRSWVVDTMALTSPRSFIPGYRRV